MPSPFRQSPRRTGRLFRVAPGCASATRPATCPAAALAGPGRFHRALPILALGLLLGACAGPRSTSSSDGSGAPIDIAPLVAPSGIVPPPAIRTVEHVETLHGVVVADPYRWLEDEGSAEGRAWVSAQETFAAEVLARATHRDALAARYARAA